MSLGEVGIFQHYNIGIALLAGIGALVLRGERRHHKHPVTATAYGAANALIMDEMLLLLDIKVTSTGSKRRQAQCRCGGRGDRAGWGVPGRRAVLAAGGP